MLPRVVGDAACDGYLRFFAGAGVLDRPRCRKTTIVARR